MGQEQSQISDQRLIEPNVSQGLALLRSSKWTNLGFKEDPRYGEFKLFENPEGQQIALINKTCQNFTEYSQLCSKLNKAKELNQLDGMIKLLEVYTQEEGNLCSSFYKVTAAYEYLNQTLADIYMNINIPVFTFLESLKPTLAKLYEQNIYHGDIAPQNILATSGELKFKLNNIQQMTGFNQYKRALIEEDCQWYLAPELLQCLANKELRPRYDLQKADVFSLGLVCLEVALKQSIQDIYEVDKYEINQKRLGYYLNLLQEMEGTQTRNLVEIIQNYLTFKVQNMLDMNPQTRVTFSELNLVRSVSPLQKQRNSANKLTLQESNLCKERSNIIINSTKYAKINNIKSQSHSLTVFKQQTFCLSIRVINKSALKIANKFELQENKVTVKQKQESAQKTDVFENVKVKNVQSQPKSTLLKKAKTQMKKPPTPTNLTSQRRK